MKTNIFKNIWPIILILALIVLFFWKFFLKGLIPIPADITVGMYYPWLDYKWGYAVGVPVKNSLLSDVVSQIYPLRIYALDLIKSGNWPLWNPLMFGGYPLLANIQIGIFNPTNILYLIFSDSFAWGMQVATQSFVIVFFTYLYLRSINLGKLPSVLGGIIFAFSGFNTIWLEWNVHGWTTAFFVLLLYSTHHFFAKPKPLFGLLISLSLCFQIFSGYPQTVFYSLIAIGFYGLFTVKFNFKRYLFFILFVILGFTLSSIQLLPTFELFLNSQRHLEILAKEHSFLPWSFLISLFAPDFFGNQTTGNFWGRNDYTNTVLYSGLIPLILATFSLKVFKNRNVRFFSFLFFFSALFSLPMPYLSSITSLGFLGQSATAATRIIFLVNFSVAVLSAFGFDYLWGNSIKIKDVARAYYLPAVVLTGVFLGIFIAHKKFISLTPVANEEFSAKILEIWLRNLRVGMKNLIIPFLLTVGTLPFFLFQSSRTKYLKKIGLIMIFLVVIIELFRFGWKFNPFIAKKLIFPRTPIIDYLTKLEDPVRVEGSGVVPMNMLVPYRVESFSAYDPMYPIKTADYLSLIDNNDFNHSKSRYGNVNNFGSQFVDLANICYFLALKVDKRIDWRFRFPRYTLIFEDKTTQVLKNNHCLPRAFMVYNYKVEKDKSELLKLLTDKKTDFSKVVFLEKEPTFEQELSMEKIKNHIDWTEYSTVKNEVQVETEKEGLLFVSDSYYPGWKSYLDGKESEIFRANYNFRAVYVPEGKHSIDFIYKPKIFILGKTISLISLFLMIFTLISFKLPLSKQKKKLYTTEYASEKDQKNW